MEFKLFERAELVALKKENKWGLFKYNRVGGKAELIPLDFAQGLSSLEVHEEYNLLITSNNVYSLNGEKILENTGKVEVIKVGCVCLLVFYDYSKFYKTQIVVWDGEGVLFSGSCSDFRYSYPYLALKFGSVWSLFDVKGNPLDEAAFQADDVEMYRGLLVAKCLGSCALYSFEKKSLIKEDQTRIVCSKECKLALCARIGDDALNVYLSGKWHIIPEVNDFGFVEGMDNLFYIKRGEKYFLYEDDMTRFMQHLYPEGVDFIAFNNGILMIVNDGEPYFYSRND